MKIKSGISGLEIKVIDDKVNFIVIDIDNAYEAGYREGQSNPKIKRLEWTIEDGDYWARPFDFRSYRITPIDKSFTIRTPHERKYFNTIEEAKAYAQSDFEKRIGECLL